MHKRALRHSPGFAQITAKNLSHPIHFKKKKILTTKNTKISTGPWVTPPQKKNQQKMVLAFQCQNLLSFTYLLVEAMLLLNDKSVVDGPWCGCDSREQH